jgi:ketosteroid isomerase-like protein
VIVPAGVPTMNDAAAIRAFWWPPDSPATTVTDFDLVQQETFGEKNFAFVRGSFMLRFLYDGKTFSSTGDYISILRCQPDGSWRIAYRQWSDHSPPSD